MGELEALFDACTDGRCHKWRHYFEIYERYLAKYRGSPCVSLEIGVAKGGSLDIMARYLGEQARIIGVDISPTCKEFEKRGYEIYTGDQADGHFLHELASRVAPPTSSSTTAVIPPTSRSPHSSACFPS